MREDFLSAGLTLSIETLPFATAGLATESAWAETAFELARLARPKIWAVAGMGATVNATAAIATTAKLILLETEFTNSLLFGSSTDVATDSSRGSLGALRHHFSAVLPVFGGARKLSWARTIK